MRVGLIARADDRGLGHLTWEWNRNMRPDSVLVIDTDDPAYPLHLDRYPGATVVRFDGIQLPEDEVRAWIDGIDVAYLPETFYDARLPGWFHDAGKRLVLHAMPEFFRWADDDLPAVRWWNPTVWRHPTLPAGAEVVPVPVPLDRWPTPAVPSEGPLRLLHVAGKRALADRNGTGVLVTALRLTKHPLHLTIAHQGPPPRVVLPKGSWVETLADTEDYWSMYDHQDALVLPRRYGGLSLPANEGAGAGLALIMPACEPNPQTWAGTFTAVKSHRPLRVPAGVISIAHPEPLAVAAAIDAFADPTVRADRMAEARAWAEAHSWDALRPEIQAALERACE